MPLPQLRRSQGRPRTKRPEIVTTVLSTDFHLPAYDRPSYSVLLNFLQDIRPDYHIILGDYFDLPSLSTFIKDPALENRTEEAIELGNTMLDEMYKASPNTITKMLWGNHDYRLTKALWLSPEILPFVSKGKKPAQLLANCLSLGERGIEWFDYKEVYMHHGLALTHGEAAGLHSAKKELDTFGVSGASGHVHAFKYWEHRSRNGVAQWWSIGAMCNREVSYRPNNGWVNGIALHESIVGSSTPANPSGVFTLTPLPIIQGKFIYNSKMYCQDGVFESKQ